MDLAELSKVLEELQLSLTRIEEWILIQRASFDLRIDEEPYHSIQMYASLATKKFVVRVWGRSCHYGEFTNQEDLKVHCIINFKNTAACVGYLGPHPGGGLKLVRVNFPCPRWISKCCDVTFEQNSEKMIIGLCGSCSNNSTSATAVKLEEIPKVKDSVGDKFDLPLKREVPSDDDEGMSDAGSMSQSTDEDDSYVPKRRPKMKRTKKLQKRLTRTPSFPDKNLENRGRSKNPSDATKMPPKDEPQTCDKCGLVLKSLNNLRHHIKAIHDNLREFKCDHPGCDREFVGSSALKKHKKARHQGGFMCDHCAKSFGQALDLREHIQMIHKGQPLNLKCKHCDKTFHSRKARLRHVNLDHFPDRYKCNICQKSSATATNLKNHMATHGAPQFECPECGKGLTSKNSLTEHMRKHTGEKPVRCPYCTWRGSTSSELNKHKNSMHKIEREKEKMKKKLFHAGHTVGSSDIIQQS